VKLRLRIGLLLLLLAPVVMLAQDDPQSPKPSSAHKRSATKKKTSRSANRTGRKTSAKKSRRKLTPAQQQARALKARRTRQAFIASADLKPMAQQLLELRTPTAYAGVEKWAREHPDSDAGSLAWLTVGYAHFSDHDYDKAATSLLKAQPHAGELSDYVAYFLAASYLNQGKSEPGFEVLKTFAARYPDSLFRREAALMYGNALITTGNPQRAVAVLAPYLPADGDSGRPDIELALARAYLRSGQNEKGVELLRHIYYSEPASAQAADARSELDKLPAGSVPLATVAERRTRAELLMQAKRYNDAVTEYRALLSDSRVKSLTELQLALAGALLKANNRGEAKQILEKLPNQADELSARRNYYLIEIARAENNEGRMRELLDRMRQSTPTSVWLEEALVTGGRFYWFKHDYAQAAPYYAELAHTFPASKGAPIAHWKAAWLTFRSGKVEDATAEFEDQIKRFPSSNEVVPALYWRARVAEEQNDPTRARGLYLKITERFRNFYYAELARARLATLGGATPTGDKIAADPLLARIPDAPQPKISESQPPADNPRVQKSRLLENGALYDFAIRELQLAAAEEGGGEWLTHEIVRVYTAGGHYNRALETMKRAVPGYFALDLDALPRGYWETLFPRPWWNDLQHYSAANGLDPFLVASLIRQESEFNPSAVSPANALGLMQVLPSTGKQMAHEMKLARFSADELFTPAVNIQLGTHYFRTLINKFGGIEYALAAYNAGGDRVELWLSGKPYRDTAEFVESIPFTETREYVQAIIRNAAVYKRLYATSQQARSGN
jgi:soluble lytic murein transglycosylase